MSTATAPNPFFIAREKGPCGPYSLTLLPNEDPRKASCGGSWPFGILDRLCNGGFKSYFCWVSGGHTFVEYDREYHYDSSETANTKCTRCNMWVPF